MSAQQLQQLTSDLVREAARERAEALAEWQLAEEERRGEELLRERELARAGAFDCAL